MGIFISIITSFSWSASSAEYPYSGISCIPANPIDLNTNKNYIENDVHTEPPLKQSTICTDERGPCIDTTNLELADEIEAVNAIYDQTVLAIEQTSQDGTVRCRFSVPGTRVLLRIVFSSEYPAERPRVAALTVYQRTASSLAQQIHELISGTLLSVFVPGVVCMFDVIEHAKEQYSLLPGTFVVSSSATSGMRRPPLRTAEQPRSPHQLNRLTDVSDLLTMGTCAICLDEVPFTDLVHLPCNHHFCTDCLHDGFSVSLKSKDSFACCARLVPLDVLDHYTITPRGTMRRYETFLIERSVKDPLYCSSRSCRQFIRPDEGGAGGLIGVDARVLMGYSSDEVRCPTCKRHTCVYCRHKMHGEGWCRDNERMKKLLEGGAVQVCGKCGHAVEKSGGCKNMVCRCGYKWCWLCKKERRSDDGGCGCVLYG